MRQLTDTVFCMDADARTDQPFVYYIHGSRYNLQVDAGNSPENYRKLLNELGECGLPKPDFIVTTHWHWDHTFGLCAAECPIIASGKTDTVLADVQTWKWDEASMKQRLQSGKDIEFTYHCIKEQYSNPADIRVRRPDITIDSGMTLDLGGFQAVIQHRDSPHTRDALFIWLPHENILIGGDAHYEDYYDNYGQYDKNRLSDFILWLESIPFITYLKGHDEPAISKNELLEFLKSELKKLPNGK